MVRTLQLGTFARLHLPLMLFVRSPSPGKKTHAGLWYEICQRYKRKDYGPVKLFSGMDRRFYEPQDKYNVVNHATS